MENVRELSVGELGQVTFTETAFTESSGIVSDPGTIKFTTLNVINSGELSVGMETTEVFTIDAISEVKVWNWIIEYIEDIFLLFWSIIRIRVCCWNYLRVYIHSHAGEILYYMHDHAFLQGDSFDVNWLL